MAYKSNSEEESGGDIIRIPAHMLPAGIQSGDHLRVASISDGMVELENAGMSDESEEESDSESPELAGPAPTGETMEEGESWEDEFRKEMSPQRKQNSAA